LWLGRHATRAAKAFFATRLHGMPVARQETMPQTSARLRWFFGLCTLAVTFAVAVPARAGNAIYTGIVAASPDAKHAAIFSLSDGFAYDSPGMLVKVDQLMRDERTVEPLVTSPCCTGFWQVLPYPKWKWIKKVPEAQTLHAFSDVFDDKSEGKHARVVVDPVTLIARLEILQQDRWWPVLAMPGGRPKVTGTLVFPGRYLVRTHHDAELRDWDEVRAFTQDEVPRVGERWLAARSIAGSATGALRELREQSARPFTKRPSGRRDADAWDYRRAKALDPVLEMWSRASAYGPLTAQDLRDFVWLLAARNAQGQKLQALRLMAGLRARDPKSAAALLDDFNTDPDLATLTPLLRANHDPMHHLPDPAMKTLTVLDLQSLKDDELLWVHRMVRAMASFRFNDQAVMDYISLFGWYQPMPAKAWQKLQVDQFFLKDPDKAALWWPRESLKAILEVEKQRGLAKPAL
jgi:hypothetical protein